MKASIILLMVVLCGCVSKPVTPAPTIAQRAAALAIARPVSAPPEFTNKLATVSAASIQPPPPFITSMTMPVYLSKSEGIYFLQASADCIHWFVVATNEMGQTLDVTLDFTNQAEFFRCGFGTNLQYATQ